MKKLNNKGFTLVEILAVITMLSLIIVVVATKGFGAFDNTKVAITEENRKTIYEAANVLMTEVKNCEGNEDIFSNLIEKFIPEGESDRTSKKLIGLATKKNDGTGCLEIPLSYLIEKNYITSQGVKDILNSSGDFNIKGCLDPVTKEPEVIVPESIEDIKITTQTSTTSKIITTTKPSTTTKINYNGELHVDMNDVKNTYIVYTDNFENYTEEKKELYLQSLPKHINVLSNSSINSFTLDVRVGDALLYGLDLKNVEQLRNINLGTYDFEVYVDNETDYKILRKENIKIINEPTSNCVNGKYSCGLSTVETLNLKDFIKQWSVINDFSEGKDNIYFRIYTKNYDYLTTCYYDDPDGCNFVLDVSGEYYIEIEQTYQMNEVEIEIDFYYDFYKFIVDNPANEEVYDDYCGKDCLLNQMAMNREKWNKDYCDTNCQDNVHANNMYISEELQKRFDTTLYYEDSNGEWYDIDSGEKIQFENYK